MSANKAHWNSEQRLNIKCALRPSTLTLAIKIYVYYFFITEYNAGFCRLEYSIRLNNSFTFSWIMKEFIRQKKILAWVFITWTKFTLIRFVNNTELLYVISRVFVFWRVVSSLRWRRLTFEFVLLWIVEMWAVGPKLYYSSVSCLIVL